MKFCIFYKTISGQPVMAPLINFVLLFTIFATFVLETTSGVEFKEEDDVIVLTDDDFALGLRKFKHLLVHFYVPWSGHCKDLFPEFSKAAQLLKEEGSDTRVAKIDVSEETDTAEEYSITAHPTVKFFHDGKGVDYGAVGRHAGDIVTFLKKKTGLFFQLVKSVDEMKSQIEINNVTVVGFFKDQTGEVARNFIELAKSLDHMPFVIADDAALFTEYDIKKDTVVVFKSFDEGRADLTENLTPEGIRDFIDVNRLPLIVEFGPEAGQKIFELKIRKHFILFIRKDASYYETRRKMFKEAAEHFRGQVIFVCLDVDDEQNKKVLDFFDLKRSDCPTTRFLLLDGPLRYKPDKDIWTFESMRKFVQDALDGKRKPYLESEDIPEDWDDGVVKILVGKNFDKIARDRTKDVFVEFHAPWCEVCKEFAPIWQKVGETFYKNPDVTIAKIDATTNEIEGIKISAFPTLFFFPRNSDEVIEYSGNKSLDRLISFVESGGKLTEETLTDKSKEEL